MFVLPKVAFTEPSDTESADCSSLAIQDTAADAESDPPSATGTAMVSSFAADPRELQAIADCASPTAFSLSGGSDSGTALSTEAEAAIEAALEPYEANGVPAGFLLLDCTTGLGIACNIDEVIYGASSFKAPYAAYVCQEHIETGLVELGTYLDYYTQSATGSYRISGYSTLEGILSDTIVYSSNGAFGSLREAFDGAVFDTWLEAQGVDIDESDGSWFPSLTVRDAAALWMNVRNYLDTETDTASLLSGLLASTETSFIRDALADVDGATVRDKAGWYADGSSSAYNSVCDSGIVSVGESDYLLCIMTGAAWSDESVDDFEDLAAAVFAARSDLTA